MNPLLWSLRGLGSRQDLPLPLPLAVTGAALVWCCRSPSWPRRREPAGTASREDEVLPG
ncbi:MAG: hypothetical protein U0R79_03265 [Propionicimonas sp.]